MIGDYDDIQRIREILRDQPHGMSITELARELGIHRTTVSKYLDTLQMRGEVDLRIVSTAKIYQLSSRIPASSLITFTRDPFLLITCRFVIALAANGIIELMNMRESVHGCSITDPALSSLIHGDLISLIKNAIKGTTSHCEWPVAIPGGQRWFSISALPIVCNDGRPGCALVCHDETEIREARKRSELSAGEADALIMDQTEFIIRFRPDGILTFVNEAFCTRMERKREDLIGFPYEPVISHEDLERLTRMRASITKKNPVITLVFKAIQPDGMVAWEEWRYRGIFTQMGELAGYQAVGRDISQLHHLEEQLESYHANFEAIVKQRIKEMRGANQDLMNEIARREKLERELLIISFVFDQASDSILVFERSGTVYQANQTACRLLGYEMEELSSLTVFDVNQEITPDIWEEMWEHAEPDDEIIRVESVHRLRSGEIIPVEVSRKFISAGPFSLFCSIARQIGPATQEHIQDTDPDRQEKQIPTIMPFHDKIID